ncbi:hypothetical protein [Roseobacter denitrificans]|uniref:hypothetical protein n=1 Tax=Roseobacter denitrificans TaxID=2434 RepID=UPI00209B72A5|nr:hypothetical protein [Roseobacter denitrificans]
MIQPTEPTETSLPFFGTGYPAQGDPCRRLGESAETIDYLDHTADLVGCPVNLSTLDDFVVQTGAVEVFRQDGFVVFSIPTGK